MENSSADWEQNVLIHELRRGRELAMQFKVNLDSSSSSIELQESLVQEIVSTFTNALSMLNWRDSDLEQLPAPPGTQSPDSGSGSPGSGDSDRVFKDQERRDISKKRKTLPKWTEHIHVNMETGLEGPVEDGYSWRKYGQKDILGAKYPRGYYRCTHRNVQGCVATKQVQRSDTNPSIFDVTYRGKHTCSQSFQLNRTITSSENRQQQRQQQPEQRQQQQQLPQQILLNFKTGLKVKTENLRDPELTSSFSFPSTSTGIFPSTSTGNTENGIFSPTAGLDNHLLGGLSPSFISPATSESNYFSLSPVNCYGGGPNLHTSESDLTEIISAATSATNSPMVDLDLMLDPVEFDPNFPFDASNFFT